MTSTVKPPVWFWIVAGLITAWGLVGIFAFYMDATMTAASAKAAGYSDYQIKLLAIRPGWFMWVYAVAVFTGLFGGIALLLRSSHARVLFLVSLVTMVFQFLYLFAATDMIAVQGFVKSAGFPIGLTIIGVAELWFATFAVKRGWIG